MLVPTRTRLVRFGAFELDLVSGDLWKAGRRVRLQKQPRQVLRILVTRGGELVTRDELRRELWPDDTFVDFDNGLNVVVRKIREALGDVAPSPRFIETERALGYRFIAPVSEIPPQIEVADVGPQPHVIPDAVAAEGDPSRESNVPPLSGIAAVTAIALLAGMGVWLWPPGAGRSPSAAKEVSSAVSLAVLPLSGGSDRDDELLAAGIADAIITRLSNVRQFRLRPSIAVASYQGKEIDVQQVGRELESQYVLVGRIQSVADRVRVRVQLIDTRNGSLVWGGQYDVERGNLLSVEDEVADEIAGALRVQVSDAERERLDRRYTQSGAAYERYLMGRARMRSVVEQDVRQAIAEFEAARDLDPRFAPAYAALAMAAAQLRVRFASSSDAEVWDARARQEAGRALELDPDLAEAHVALAAVHRFQEYDWDTVITESRRAIELNPSLDMPHLYLAVAYFHIGLLEEAESAIAMARQLNPENRIEPLEVLGAVHLFGGRISAAVAQLSRATELSDSRIAQYMLAWALYYQGEIERAEVLLTAMLEETGPVSSNARGTLAAIRARRGAAGDARALARRVASEPDLIHHAAYALGTTYAQLRDPASAVRWLSQAAATGFSCYPWYAKDTLLDPIRSDPGFAAFMRELRRSWEDARAKYSG
jgi:TolB-like protein/DNA-binding winged helix-turn-helix (wHTH) protein/lipopolysaccharide biosynthesis regulator YciM